MIYWDDMEVGAERVFGSYEVTRQSFDFDYSEEHSRLIRNSPIPRTFVAGTDFLRNTFDSGSPKGTRTVIW